MTTQRSTAQPAPNQPADAASQPARDRNIRAIVSYFEGGIKPKDELGNVGIELEHTIARRDLTPVPYSGEAGVARVLEALSADYPDVTRDDAGDILGVARAGESITIEPAAQIELSAGPFGDLHRARAVFDAFEATLDRELSHIGAQALATGYHPTARARDLELIPKRRYELMNAYLSGTDTCGPCMMRGSASTQVSIDYSSADDCLRKLRLACAIVPVLSLICDNSPVFEGAPRAGKLVRTHIWNHMDADRCGIVPGALSTSFTLEAYASYILDTPAILVQDPATNEWVADSRTFGEIYATRAMNRADVEHALSMFFTDVRLKTYLEIRPADTMPVPYAMAYAALIKGLFYSERSLCALERLISDVTEKDVARAKRELMAHGYEGRVYGRDVAGLCDELVAIANAGLPTGEREVLEPLAALVSARTTLADIAERTGFLRADCPVREVARRAEQAARLPRGSNEDLLVTVAYLGRFDDGAVFLDQRERPIEFPCEDGWMPPEIIDAVKPLRPGQTATARVEPRDAYAPHDPAQVLRMRRTELPEHAAFEVGSIVHLEGTDGVEHAARVVASDADSVTFDANQAAVAKALNFDITLLAVRSPH